MKLKNEDPNILVTSRAAAAAAATRGCGGTRIGAISYRTRYSACTFLSTLRDEFRFPGGGGETGVRPSRRDPDGLFLIDLNLYNALIFSKFE